MEGKVASKHQKKKIIQESAVKTKPKKNEKQTGICTKETKQSDHRIY